MKQKNAFTLVEISVVVAIIAILCVTLVPKILDNMHQAKLVTTINDAYSLESFLMGKNLTPDETVQRLNNNAEFKEIKNAFNKNVQGIHQSVLKNTSEIPIDKEIIVYSEQPVQATINNLPEGVIAVYKNKTYYGTKGKSIVDGFIEDSHGDRIPGVIVELQPSAKTTITNGDGYFMFSSVADDTHTLAINQNQNPNINVVDLDFSIRLGENIINSALISGNQTATFRLQSNIATVNSEIGKRAVNPTASTTPVTPSPAPDDLDKLKLGDYVKLGKFDGKDLVWRVVKVQSNDVMLFLSEPLKNADGTWHKKIYDVGPDPNEPTDSGRNSYGSNNYCYSDIRIWLNNTFFNTAFSNKEIIKETTFDYILANIDKAQATTGTEPHRYSYTFITAIENYDSAFKNTISDKVYLVSIKELVENIQPTIGSNYYSDAYGGYWLRDSYVNYSSDVRIVGGGGYFSNDSIFDYSAYLKLPVRPATNINSAIITSGYGTQTEPYVIQ